MAQLVSGSGRASAAPGRPPSPSSHRLREGSLLAFDNCRGHLPAAGTPGQPLAGSGLLGPRTPPLVCSSPSLFLALQVATVGMLTQGAGYALCFPLPPWASDTACPTPALPLVDNGVLRGDLMKPSSPPFWTEQQGYDLAKALLRSRGTAGSHDLLFIYALTGASARR